MKIFRQLAQAARTAPPSAAFVALATLAGTYLWTAFDLRWADPNSSYMRLTIATDVAKGGLPPLLLGMVITVTRERLARAALRPRKHVASVTTYVAAAFAGAIFGTLVTAISRIVTGTFFVF